MILALKGFGNNRITAFPIYVTVQEKFCIGVIADDYSAICPYVDGETRHERRSDANDGEKEVKMGYIWIDREFFLTIKGAEEYMEANAHNHGKLRTYVHHFERRNFEMNGLLENLGFRTT